MKDKRNGRGGKEKKERRRWGGVQYKMKAQAGFNLEVPIGGEVTCMCNNRGQAILSRHPCHRSVLETPASEPGKNCKVLVAFKTPEWPTGRFSLQAKAAQPRLHNCPPTACHGGYTNRMMANQFPATLGNHNFNFTNKCSWIFLNVTTNKTWYRNMRHYISFTTVKDALNQHHANSIFLVIDVGYINYRKNSRHRADVQLIFNYVL